MSIQGTQLPIIFKAAYCRSKKVWFQTDLVKNALYTTEEPFNCRIQREIVYQFIKSIIPTTDWSCDAHAAYKCLSIFRGRVNYLNYN